jgi:hypothetical protein
MNPYFTWQVLDDGAAEGWRPFADLLDPGVAGERVEVSRQALVAMYGLAPDAVPERVVASVLFLGYAARLVSPLLRQALDGGVQDLTPDDLWWREVPGGPLPIAVRPHTATTGDLEAVAVHRLTKPLLETFHRRFRLSEQVLWGNVASAFGGAAGQLGEGAWKTVDALLQRPPLRGMATVDGHRLYRRNCCLYYRIPGGGTCGDCVLNPRTEPQELNPKN